MSPAAYDTIVMPTQMLRADGIPPVTAAGSCCERAIYKFPGHTAGLSLPWIAGHDCLLLRMTVISSYDAEAYDGDDGDVTPTMALTIAPDDPFVYAPLVPYRLTVELPGLPVRESLDVVYVGLSGNHSAYQDLSVFITTQCVDLPE